MYWLEIDLPPGALIAVLVLGVIIVVVTILMSTPRTKMSLFLDQSSAPKEGSGKNALSKDGATPTSTPFMDLINQGNTLLGQYHYDQALKCFQDALKLKNNDPAVHFKIGRIFLQKEDYKNAMAAFRNTLSLNPSQIDAHYELARIFQAQKNLDAAHQELDKALALNPNHEETLKLKIKLFEQIANYRDALPIIKTLTSISRYPMKYRSMAAEYQINLGQYDDGIAEYESLIAVDPDNRLLYQGNIGHAYFEQGDYDRAIAAFKIVLQEQNNKRKNDYTLKVRSQLAAALCNQGVTRFEEGDYPLAIQQYQEALLYDDSNPDIHFNMGKALSRQNDAVKALQHFQKAIDLNPNDISSYYEMAVLQDDKGMIAEAIANYGKVLALDPRNLYANYGLGTLYGIQNDLKNSIKYLSAAIAINPRFVDAIYNLAVALERKKDVNKAAQMYKKVLTLAPHHEKARSNLAHLKHTQKS